MTTKHLTNQTDPWEGYVAPPKTRTPDERAATALAGALKTFPHPLYRGAHLLPFQMQKVDGKGDLAHRLEREPSLYGTELRVWRRSWEDLDLIDRSEVDDRPDLRGSMPYEFLVTHGGTNWCAFYNERDLLAWAEAYGISDGDGHQPEPHRWQVGTSTTLILPGGPEAIRPMVREVRLGDTDKDGMRRSSLVLEVHCKHNGGMRYRTKLAIGYVPPTTLARRVFQGPLVPGPWPYTFPLSTVIQSARNARDPETERRQHNMQFAVDLGGLYRIDGQVYELVDDVPLDYPRFRPLDAS